MSPPSSGESSSCPVPSELSERTREQQRPQRRSLWQALWHKSDWKCLLLTLLIYACALGTMWCRPATHLNPKATPGATPDAESALLHTGICPDSYVYIPMALLLVAYTLYLLECWHCRVCAELRYRAEPEGVADLVRRMQQATPCIWWKAVSYHYVQRIQYRSSNPHSGTQAYHERVNTHTAEAELDHGSCGVRDASRPIDGLDEFGITEVCFTKCFSFANAESEDSYLAQRAHFFAENEGLDDYMEAREGMHLKDVDFRERVIAVSRHRAWFWWRSVFWLAAVLTLSWPLRVLTRYSTAFLHYHVEKLFGLDYAPYTRRLPRASTADSTELEWHIRSNRRLVPSYSEAVLLPCLDSFTRQNCERCMLSPSASSIFSRGALGPLSMGPVPDPSPPSPPGYQDALNFPVLIVHRNDGCFSHEHRLARSGISCEETSL